MMVKQQSTLMKSKTFVNMSWEDINYGKLKANKSLPGGPGGPGLVGPVTFTKNI